MSCACAVSGSETRKVVTVTATDDSEVDAGENPNLSLPANADLPTGIRFSEGPGRVIYFSGNDFQYQASHAGGTTLSVNEQAGTLTATVRVEAPNVAETELNALNEIVVLSVSTADGMATAGQDYTSVSQTLTFAPADFAVRTFGCPPPTPNYCTRADKTVTVAITDDTAYEGAETFTLTLSHETDQRVTYPSPCRWRAPPPRARTTPISRHRDRRQQLSAERTRQAGSGKLAVAANHGAAGQALKRRGRPPKQSISQ